MIAGLSVVTFLLALTVSGILKMLLVGLTLTTAYTLIVLMTLFWPAVCSRSSATWTLLATIGSLVVWLLFLPLAYLFGPVFGFGLFTIWLLQGSSRLVTAILFVSMWRGRHWQRIVV